ncbi:uncharacterized protein DUF2752 [Chitinophaga skermanii]|uniref:Uncharacterized protein DUF2752 n=1 Tax=Chitinophaga skermanii TaxID=331697 RepID=A0A327QE99_9BACT|nr:uncharacterized protein DUF2752 [Chitinophaga skermanii]
MYKIISRIQPELCLWVFGIAALAITDPYTEGMSLCLAKFIGLPWCPGCGFGHAIGFIFRGEIALSIQAHPLGIPLLAILLYRIFQLSNIQIQQFSAPKPRRQ